MNNLRKQFTQMLPLLKKELGNICVNCGIKCDSIHYHHIVPLSKGGTNNISNIVPLCEKCHGAIHGINFASHSELTKEGIKRAKEQGKQIGQVKGTKLVTKKSIEMKEQILKYSKEFNGSLSDVDCIKLLGIARNSYYKYKKELKEM